MHPRSIAPTALVFLTMPHAEPRIHWLNFCANPYPFHGLHSIIAFSPDRFNLQFFSSTASLTLGQTIQRGGLVWSEDAGRKVPPIGDHGGVEIAVIDVVAKIAIE